MRFRGLTKGYSVKKEMIIVRWLLMLTGTSNVKLRTVLRLSCHLCLSTCSSGGQVQEEDGTS